MNAEDLWKIACFDIWVENDDRKPSNPNLLLQITDKGTKIFAIDHAFTFLTLPYKNIDVNWGVSQGFNDNILETDLAKEILQGKARKSEFREMSKDFFFQKVEESKAVFHQILQNIPTEFELDTEDHQSLVHFLFDENRNQQVINYFFEHLDEYA
ncbi:MAG: HipA family kinase [Microscillaceae bacterium]|nr:HipA family kinase [Microscillaceae bacterium]